MRRSLMVIAVLLTLLTTCIWISGCSEEKVSAEDLLAESGRNFMEIDSYRARMDATLEISGDASDYDPDFDAVLPLNLGFGGQIDLDTSDTDSIRMRVYDMSIDGLTDMIRKAGEASGDSDMGAIMGAGMYSQMLSGMEVVIIEDTIYLQMGGAWFDFKLSDLPVSDGADFSKADLNCMIASTFENESAWGQGDVTNVQELDEEEIDGVRTRHITGSLDPEAAINQPENTAAIQDKCGFGDLAESTRDDAYDEDSAGDDQSGTSTGDDKDAEARKKDDAEQKALIESIAENLKVDYWIDGENNLRQQRIDMEFSFGDMGRILGEDKDAEGLKDVVMKISLTTKMSHYGEAMDIVAPKDTTSLKGFFDEMSDPGMGFGGSRTEQV